MDRRLLTSLLWVSACTDRLIVDDGTLGAEDTDVATTAVTNGTTDRPRPGETEGSDGPIDTSGDDSDTFGTSPPDPSGVTDSDTDGPPSSWCWQTQPMFEAPENVRVYVTDQDFDGRDELWLSFDADPGPGPGDTALFAVDGNGQILGESHFGGFVRSLGDIDGNGLRDVISIDFSGGGPSFAWAPAFELGSFAVPPLPMNLELSQGITGFFDATFDGVADVFRLHPDERLELSVGDGLGGFAPVGETPLPYFGPAEVSPVRGGEGWAVLRSVAGFGGGGGDCEPTQYFFLSTWQMGLVLETSTDPVGFPQLGPLRDATFVPEVGAVVLAVESCEPGNDLHDLRQVVWTPGSDLYEAARIDDKLWSTLADFDGDGRLDAIYLDPADMLVSVAWGEPGLDFGPPEPIEILGEDVRRNNVRRIDTDGDGYDEIVRGVVIADGDPAQLLYERVFYGPC